MRLIGIIGLIVTLLLIMIAIDAVSCQNRWEASGFKSQYGITTGCMIQMPDGRWIPSENYREL